VSPVFRHGGLRLYLLKLLDEAPRHGYEVIRLLQDRFLGVYAPSPGTIYPRLARLEEEGLVTHDEVDGRKVYRITDKGREEINSRLDDLAELEEELTQSVRDIAREVSEDVRDTVRNLREELTWAARDVRRPGGGSTDARDQAKAREDARERARRTRDEVRESARRTRDEARQAHDGPGNEQDARDAARQAAHAQHEQTTQDRQLREDARQAARESQERHRSARREWADWASSQWPGWTGWRERPWGQAGRGWPGAPGGPGGPGLDVGMFRDLERLAVDFGRELSKAAASTESIGENALGDLRSILEDALARIKNEVFRGAPPDDDKDEPERDGPADS
jgi:DNA-binding PadR family transcriptional regulator